MYIFTRTLVETIKTFCISVLCSAVFSVMIYRDTVLFNKTVCFILNLTALILFLFLYYRNWSKAYARSLTLTEYMVPALISYSLYLGSSLCLYMAKASMIYRWIFQHTRFLEPLFYSSDFVVLSYILAQTLTLAVLIFIPIYHGGRRG